MKTNEKSKKEKKSYWPVAFRWKLILELAAGLINEQQACEKYGITVILIRQWRNRIADAAVFQPQDTTTPNYPTH